MVNKIIEDLELEIQNSSSTYESKKLKNKLNFFKRASLERPEYDYSKVEYINQNITLDRFEEYLRINEKVFTQDFEQLHELYHSMTQEKIMEEKIQRGEYNFVLAKKITELNYGFSIHSLYKIKYNLFRTSYHLSYFQTKYENFKEAFELAINHSIESPHNYFMVSKLLERTDWH